MLSYRLLRSYFYAVRVGRKPGIYLTWDEAKQEVSRWPAAEHKKFAEFEKAIDYLRSNYSIPPMSNAPTTMPFLITPATSSSSKIRYTPKSDTEADTETDLWSEEMLEIAKIAEKEGIEKQEVIDEDLNTSFVASIHTEDLPPPPLTSTPLPTPPASPPPSNPTESSTSLNPSLPPISPISESDLKTHHFTLYADGGSRGNPGNAGIGYVIYCSDGRKVAQDAVLLSENSTNNEAEYNALIYGLKRAREMGIRYLKVMMDSKLVVYQCKAKWNINSPNLIPLNAQARAEFTKFSKFSITHIPREKNSEADTLANQAMDRRLP